MFEKAVVDVAAIRKQKTAPGVLMQNLGRGALLNALHWNMDDGSVVEWHSHENEQFGYVIKGGFKMFFSEGDGAVEEYEIGKGDCYFVPPNANHKFIAVGDTEAIDVFYPIRTGIPKEIE